MTRKKIDWREYTYRGLYVNAKDYIDIQCEYLNGKLVEKRLWLYIFDPSSLTPHPIEISEELIKGIFDTQAELLKEIAAIPEKFTKQIASVTFVDLYKKTKGFK